MAFDNATRNRLQKFVNDARDLLGTDFTRQLQHEYGLDPKSGTITDLDKLTALDARGRETAKLLREILEHMLANMPKRDTKAALDRLVREQAFTVLNRLCALRMAEARGLLIESVAQGYESKGFQLYKRLAGPALGETGDAYRAYLFSVFDEFALDLPVLFDRYSPMGRLFPKESVLLELLDEINHGDLDHLWAEDETIGWIYQYFNSADERKKMRKESQAPRNSRELAVRNQFFTPRYVVEFLTDNTLGRIWYEMCQGNTRLKDTCQYLVRRPNEVFLARSTAEEEGEDEVQRLADALLQGRIPDWPAEERAQGDLAIQLGHCVDAYQREGSPAMLCRLEDEYQALDNLKSVPLQELWDFLFLSARADRQSGCGTIFRGGSLAMGAAQEILDRLRVDERAERSQEELLRAPVLVPYRPRKDPRELKILDPACGSGHFLLYAFDLLEAIYEETWKTDEKFREKFPGCWIKADCVSVRNWDEVTCFATGERLDRETAMLAVQSPGPLDPPGRFHIYSPEKVEGLGGISYVQRLAEMDWTPFLSEGWVDTYAFRGNKPDYIACEEFTEEEALSNFRRLIPRLIVENNLFGIDIDLRAVQIAGLTLWLRAQRSWHTADVKPANRPQITKSNVVCAEPMPQEQDFIDAFADTLDFQPAELFRKIIPETRLAGDAGSLLKIEKVIQETIPEVYVAHGELFQEEDQAQWSKAEEELLDALQSFAEQSRDGTSYRRRLFANDAARGFALVDVLRERFDAVLMNPPFGTGSKGAKSRVDKDYKAWRYDVFPCFVSRGSELLSDGGRLGALTTRTGFFLSRMETWRRQILLGSTRLTTVADLGHQVLDDALVEVAAYVISNESDKEFIAISCLKKSAADKEAYLLHSIRELCNCNCDSDSDDTFLIRHSSLLHLPLCALAYWVPRAIQQSITTHQSLEQSGFSVREGLHTSDNDRFLRLWWEVPPESASNGNFVSFAKGGDYSPYHSDLHLCLDWTAKGRDILASKHGVVPSRNLYLQPGLTFTRRTASTFSARPLPANSIFSESGMIIYHEDKQQLLVALSYLMTNVARYILEMFVGSGEAAHAGSAARHFLSGIVGSVPFPNLTDSDNVELESIAKELSFLQMELRKLDETQHIYEGPILSSDYGTTLESAERNWREKSKSIADRIVELSYRVEMKVIDAFRLDAEAVHCVSREVCPHPGSYNKEARGLAIEELIETPDDELVYQAYSRTESRGIMKQSYHSIRRVELFSHLLRTHPSMLPVDVIRQRNSELAESVVAYIVGVVFGRWPLPESATQELNEVTYDPFAPLADLSGAKFELSKRHVCKPSRPNERIFQSHEGEVQELSGECTKVLQHLWAHNSAAFEGELLEKLSARSLREYINTPSGFFVAHLSKYSKSRRQAPIYWPLTTPSNSYTLWVYYHDLNDQTLYMCVNDFVDFKLRSVSEDAAELRAKVGRSTGEEKELEHLTDFEAELKDFRDELLRVAEFWNPNLNDGVQITAAPLWRLFQHKPWQKKLRETWEKLEKGDYDWAHLALSIWPDRVVRASHKDRSLAIAHDLEDALWEEAEVTTKTKSGKTKTKTEWRPRTLTEAELNAIVAEVKAR